MSLIKKANENYDPTKIDSIIIASRAGLGKTEAIMQLPNSIIFDYEGSSGYYNGNGDVVDIKEIMKLEKCGPIRATEIAINELKSIGHQYDFCIIDTISRIDEAAERVALIDYKNSPEGQNYKGDTVMTLSYGAGYTWQRNAFQKIIKKFENIAPTLILIGHVKDASIKKDGESVTINDLALTGSLKLIFSAKQDACAIMTMDKEEPNKRYLDFRKIEEGDFVKARVKHLSGKKILISEMVDGTLKTYWNNIFKKLETPTIKSKVSKNDRELG